MKELPKNELLVGDCVEKMQELPEASIHTVITDPPYGLEFMGEEWDSFSDNEALQEWTKRWAKEAKRVTKPGGLILCFGGTRTFHRIACGIEDAGWEIRDTLMWVYGTGFPKSHNISKAIDKKKGKKDEREVVGKHQDPAGTTNYKVSNAREEVDITAPATDQAKKWDGYGTALKPAWEPIIMAMKPKDGTYAENALEHGVAGINVDGGRIGSEGGTTRSHQEPYGEGGRADQGGSQKWRTGHDIEKINKGRFPANVIHDGSEEATDGMQIKGDDKSRYFYCAKASKKERNKGLEEFEEKVKEVHIQQSDGRQKAGENESLPTKNHHPTVKPLALMEYLARLTMPPDGGTVLDPFIGSGTTAMACKQVGRDYIGIEQNEEYVDIAEARIEATNEKML